VDARSDLPRLADCRQPRIDAIRGGETRMMRDREREKQIAADALLDALRSSRLETRWKGSVSDERIG